MKEPASKLPWKVEQVDWIYNADATPVLYGSVIEQEDAEYIVQACNLFPEAVELLEKLLDVTLEHNELALAYKIEEFLTKLENDSTGE